jgi:hypothetical protein
MKLVDLPSGSQTSPAGKSSNGEIIDLNGRLSRAMFDYQDIFVEQQ